MPKVTIYTECLQGSGELTMARDLALKLREAGLGVSLVSGADNQHLHDLEQSGVEFVKIPELEFDVHTGIYSIWSEGKKERYELFGKEAVPLRETRTQQIVKATGGSEFIVIVSGWPFWLGEGILDEEMQTMLKANSMRMRPAGISVVTRDIISADSSPMQGGESAILELFDRNRNLRWYLLGDQNVVSKETTFSSAGQIGRYAMQSIGYAAEVKKQGQRQAEVSEILVTAGGRDFRRSSYNLFKAAAKAAEREDMRGKTWHFIVPGNKNGLEAEHDEVIEDLGALAKKGVNAKIYEIMPKHDLEELYNRGPLLVSQAGIGFIKDIMEYQLRAILIPINAQVPTIMPNGRREVFEFQEQSERAAALEKAGLARVVSEDSLSPEELSAKIWQAINGPTPDFSQLHTGGLDEFAWHIVAQRAGRMSQPAQI